MIRPAHINTDLLSMTIEKHTRCRVFRFFSYEETLLYRNLNPKLIITDQQYVRHSEDNIDSYTIPSHLKLVDEVIDELSLLNTRLEEIA